MVKSKREIRGVTIVSNLPFDDNEATQHDTSATEVPLLSSTTTTTKSANKNRSGRSRTENKNDAVVDDLDSALYADDDDDNDSQADDSATISAADAGSADCGTATTLDSIVEPRPLHFKGADCWTAPASPVPHESASQRLPDTPSSLLRRDSPSSHKLVASSEVCVRCARLMCELVYQVCLNVFCFVTGG
jgi:hypothetical protein